ncbi:MAG: MATE family efflux transporter [Dorea sp.]|nr:MATE family efflux transporter [Dorea sp.]
MKRKLKFGLAGTIFALAWPTMLEQLMQTAVQYIDTAMVGAIGTYATAAVGSTTTVNWLINSSLFAFGVGFLAHISQALGAGKEEKARKAAGQAVFMVLVLGIVCSVVILSLSRYVPIWMRVDPKIQELAGRYFFIIYTPILFRTAYSIFGTVLRAAGDTKTPMRIGLMMNVMNIILNFFLIYESRVMTLPLVGTFTCPGAGMGAIGAATASAVSFTMGGLLITTALMRHPVISPVGTSIKPDLKVLIPCLRVAFPNMVQRFCTSFGYVIFASMINSLGNISTAAHTIANTVESAFYIPGYGMMTASATLTGNAYGAGDEELRIDTGRMIVFIEVMLMLLSGGLLFIFAPQMVSLFSRDPQVQILSVTVLRMVAVSEPFYGISIVVEGMLQGLGQTVKPFIYNVSCMWGIRIVGTFICTGLLGMGLVSAWGCMIANNMVLFLLFGSHYKRKLA